MAGFIDSVLVQIGGAAVLAVGFAYWAMKRMSVRIDQMWGERFEQRMAELRANMSTTQALVTAASSSASSGYLVAQERRILAVERLWAEVLHVRKNAPGPPFMLDLLSSEMMKRAKRDALKELLPAANSMDAMAYVVENTKPLREIESERPFVGERLWLLYKTYLAFPSLVLVELARGLEDDEPPRSLRDVVMSEPVTRTLVRNVLGEDHVAKLGEQEIGVFQAVRDAIEFKILEVMEARLAGAEAASIGYDEAARLRAGLLQTERERSEKSVKSAVD